MLVISRRQGQTLIIEGTDYRVEIAVLSSRYPLVTIGIKAPDSLPVNDGTPLSGSKAVAMHCNSETPDELPT